MAVLVKRSTQHFDGFLINKAPTLTMTSLSNTSPCTSPGLVQGVELGLRGVQRHEGLQARTHDVSIWISEGLTEADSSCQGVEFPGPYVVAQKITLGDSHSADSPYAP